MIQISKTRMLSYLLLEFVCGFGGILQYALEDERYYLKRLLSYKKAYYVVAFQDGVTK